MIDVRRLAIPVVTLTVALASTAIATPPKPTIQGGTDTASGASDKSGQASREAVAAQNAMALRGGVGEDVWLEALHRLTRVPSPRREQVTRAVRAYIIEAAAWRSQDAVRLKSLTAELLAAREAAREAGEPVPKELVSQIRRIRQAMPRLSDLQSRVWDVLNSPEQSRLVDEVTELKRKGLPKDIEEGRRAPGRPAKVTVKPIDGETDGEAATETTPTSEGDEAKTPASTLLWSFVDDPNAGMPLPDPEDASKDGASVPGGTP